MATIHITRATANRVGSDFSKNMRRKIKIAKREEQQARRRVALSLNHVETFEERMQAFAVRHGISK